MPYYFPIKIIQYKKSVFNIEFNYAVKNTREPMLPGIFINLRGVPYALRTESM